MNPEEIAQAIADVQAQLQTIADAVMAGTASAEDVAKLDELEKSLNDLNSKKALIEKAATLVNNATKSTQEAKELSVKASTKVNALPVATSNAEVKASNPKHKRTKFFDSDEIALKFARTLRDMETGSKKSILVEGTDSLGGLFVTPEISGTILRLASDFGIYERAVNSVTGNSNALRINKALSRGATFYAGTELGAMPANSALTYDPLTLTVKEFIAKAQVSQWLDDDASINFADEVANAFSQGLARTIDNCGFIGDGSQTYNGIVGANYMWYKLLTAQGATTTSSAERAKLASYHETASNSAIVKADIDMAIRKVAGANKKIYVNELFFGGYMEPLYTTQYSLTPADVENGVNAKWGGYPIVFTESLPSTFATNTCPIVIADFNAGATMYKNGDLTIEKLARSASDSYAHVDTYLAYSRFAIENWDCGNYHATASERVRGTIGGLIIKN